MKKKKKKKKARGLSTFLCELCYDSILKPLTLAFVVLQQSGF